MHCFPDIPHKKSREIWREKTMTKIQNIGMYTQPKTTTKQIPLFEEEDDGNLIPYIDIKDK